MINYIKNLKDHCMRIYYVLDGTPDNIEVRMSGNIVCFERRDNLIIYTKTDKGFLYDGVIEYAFDIWGGDISKGKIIRLNRDIHGGYNQQFTFKYITDNTYYIICTKAPDLCITQQGTEICIDELITDARIDSESNEDKKEELKNTQNTQKWKY